ncbi:MAG: GntR family transcriptional regulator [Hyphomicrobiales bacterium]|nr:MAG: GntR family transcriptional regulator [Hyphomicrobiales bacterium]
MQLGPIADRAIDHGAAVGPQLCRHLREAIIQNDISPGARLSEAEIARLFAVSRQPVREAFIRLAEEGLLEIRPQRGTFVRKISSQAVKDSGFVREAVESDIVKILAQAPDALLMDELRRQLAVQRKAAKNNPKHFERKNFITLDELFHQTMAEGAGKAYAWNVVVGLKAQMDRVRFLSLKEFPLTKVIDQHTAIVEAIAAGNVAEAELAIRSHISGTLVELPVIARSNPDFFEDTGQ